jgi:hypothetical protein
MERIDGAAGARGMSDIPPVRPARKLPVEIVVKRAFLFSWESRHVLLLPFLIYATLTILAELFVSQIASADNHGPIYVLTAVEQVFAMAFAVGVHRYVLLGETHAGFGFFRWDRHFVRYVLVTVLLFILGVLAAVPAAASLASGGGPNAGAPALHATAFFGLITLLMAAAILIRLSLLLPSAAIGDETRAKTIWEMTQGNSFRLMAATLMTVLPFLIVEVVLLRLVPENGGAIEIIVTIAVGLVSPAQLIALTVLLALCYDLLVRGNGPVVTDRRNG